MRKNPYGSQMRMVFVVVVSVLFFMTGHALAGGKLSSLEEEAAGAAPMEMTLAEAVNVALRSNRTIKSAFLTRVVQKFDLAVARDKFNPDVNLNATAGYSGSQAQISDPSTSESSSNLSLTTTATASKRIETGGTFTFSWSRADELSNSSGSAENRSAANNWTVNFSHPLLKGAGVAVNTASVTLAELSEQSNLLSHRDTIISTVNSTIQAFRSYARSVRSLDISSASLERSRANLEMNRLLISLGRMPANEIIQSESDVSNQEFSHEVALNSMANARISLLKVLDLPQDTQILPVEETDMSPVHPDLDDCLALAFANRSDYLNAKMAVDRARINLVLARDNKKLALDLVSGYTYRDNYHRISADMDNHAWQVGLNLQIPLYGDMTREQTLLSAETSLKQTQIHLEEIRQNIALEVRDAVREVETRLKQVGMAERSRKLAEKKLAVEKEKLTLGRTTNFQLVSFQNDLVDRQNAELNARVDYLNALTALDTILSTTLKTWRIDYNKEYDRWPGK
jgi:outer membrane protein TolC